MIYSIFVTWQFICWNQLGEASIGADEGAEDIDDVKAFLKGGSWSPIDPRSMSKMEYRELMGIGEWNRMNKVAHGIIKENTIFTIMKAIPYGSFEGKGPEILIEFDKIKYISTYTW